MVLNNKFIFQILINLFSKKIKTMKVAKIFLFAIVLLFFSCKNENNTDFNKRCRIYQKYFVDNRGEKRRDSLAITRLFNEEYRQKIF